MMALEKWTQKELTTLGIDDVFTPYILGMLNPSMDEESMHESILDVLMGWLPLSSKEDASKFTSDLISQYKNPHKDPLLSSLPNLDAEIIPAEVGNDFQKIWSPAWNSFDRDMQVSSIHDEAMNCSELKATASSFVPGISNSKEHSSVSDRVIENSTEGKAEEFEEVDITTDEEVFWWSVGQELVDQLLWKFPEYHPLSILEILKSVDLDINRALAILRAIYDCEQSGTNQVCRHYLQGECRRADCMFLHDTYAVTCRFWLRGSCIQEEDCIFLHGCVENEMSNANYGIDSEDESDGETLPDLNNEDKFPSLAATAPKSIRQRSKFEDSDANISMDFARALSLNPSPFPLMKNKAQKSIRPMRYKNTTINGKWLSTGDTVASQYKELRAKASEYAKVRNRCFMNATQAYLGGDKAKAKELSLKGQTYNQSMKECHLSAAKEIFQSRNPPEQIYEDRLLDLHGLHVAEAIELLNDMLATLSEEGFQQIYLVTGTGHHSSGPHRKARLRPAVERFLQTEGYEYSEVADRKGFVGMLLVNLFW